MSETDDPRQADWMAPQFQKAYEEERQFRLFVKCAAVFIALGLIAVWATATPRRIDAAPAPKLPSELILASPDGVTTITLRAVHDGARIQISQQVGGKESSARIEVSGMESRIRLADQDGTETVTIDDLRELRKALGR